MRELLCTLAIVIVARANADAGPCGRANGCAVTVPGLIAEIGVGLRQFVDQLGPPREIARTLLLLGDRRRAVIEATRSGAHASGVERR